MTTPAALLILLAIISASLSVAARERHDGELDLATGLFAVISITASLILTGWSVITVWGWLLAS